MPNCTHKPAAMKVGAYSSRLAMLYLLLVRPPRTLRSASCASALRHKITRPRTPTLSLALSLALRQICDVVINGLSDADATRPTQTYAIFMLSAQVSVRIGCFLCSVLMLTSSSHAWRDELLLDFCGLLSVTLVSLILSLFHRVYRVMLSSYTSKFPTVLDFWGDTYYKVLLLCHFGFTLIFYYMSLTAAHRMGSEKYFAGRRREGGVAFFR